MIDLDKGQGDPDGRTNIKVHDFHMDEPCNVALSTVYHGLFEFAVEMMQGLQDIRGSSEFVDQYATVLLGNLKGRRRITKLLILLSCMMHTLEQIKEEGP